MLQGTMIQKFHQFPVVRICKADSTSVLAT